MNITRKDRVLLLQSSTCLTSFNSHLVNGNLNKLPTKNLIFFFFVFLNEMKRKIFNEILMGLKYHKLPEWLFMWSVG